jgi:hypothetical protein
MWSWWSSADAVSLAGSIARWTGAVVAIAILVLGNRLTTLQSREKQPRIITPEQRRQFNEFLSRLDKGKILLKCIVNDKEASAFALSLRDMLKGAGFEVNEEMPGFIPVTPMSGIELKIKDKSSPPPHSGNLQKALEAIGIHAPASGEPANDSLSNDTVALYVAGKP